MRTIKILTVLVFIWLLNGCGLWSDRLPNHEIDGVYSLYEDAAIIPEFSSGQCIENTIDNGYVVGVDSYFNSSKLLKFSEQDDLLWVDSIDPIQDRGDYKSIKQLTNS